MTKYVTATDQRWEATEVRGVKMEKCLLWEGKHHVRSALYRMLKGTQLPSHHHAYWVQVFVISGKMQVEAVGSEAHTMAAGEYYFVEPGETHVETALEDTQLLVLAQEGREGVRQQS
jgi:quercetin dioxygenase-like cupin family protein